MVLFEADLNERGVHSRVGGIDRGKVGCNADVRDDHIEVFRGDHAPDFLFHLGDVVIRYLDTSSGRDFHIHHKLARVGPGEERLPQQGIECETANDKQAEDLHDKYGAVQTDGDCLFVSSLKFMKPQVELVDDNSKDLYLSFCWDRGLKTFFNSGGSVMCMTRVDGDEQGTKEGDHGHCHQVRSKQGEDYGKGQRCEEVFTYAEEKDNWEEDDAGAEGSSQNGELHLFPSLDCSFRWRFSHLHVPEDVLQNHNGIVNQAG